MDRTPRTASGRESEARRKPWTPPALLASPPAPPGWVYKWIRVSIRGDEDKVNLSSRLREGWEPVKASEHPDFIAPTIEEGRYEGVIGVGGLLLCKMPAETVAERRAYYDGRTAEQSKAVEDTIKQNQASAAAEGLRIDVTRRTDVSVGSGT